MYIKRDDFDFDIVNFPLLLKVEEFKHFCNKVYRNQSFTVT